MVKETKLYDLLGISPSANETEIKKAYRKAALKYHPDKATGDTEKFKEISEAFDILSNEEKRQVYDDYGLEAARGNAPAADNPFAGAGGPGGARGPGGGGAHFSFSGGNPFSQADAFNIFSQMGGFGMDDGFGHSGYGSAFGGSGFGGGMPGGMPGGFSGASGRSRRPEPDTFTMPLPVSLEDLYNGATKKMKLNRKSSDGSKESKVLEVKLKPGWKAGTKINFANEGDYQQECQARQTIQFVLEEKPHPLFTRDGNDVIAKIPLTFKEALLGFNKEVTTLSGKKINISRTTPVQPTSTNRYPNLGMPISREPGRYGDLVITYKIDFPTHLSLEQKEAIKKAF